MSRLEFGKRYTNPEDFFSRYCSAAMRLTPDAAQGVCFLAGSRGYVVSRVEGGVWKDPDFEARGDCIWDGVDPPVSADDAIINNDAAARFIESQSKVHDVFIVTVSLREQDLMRPIASTSENSQCSRMWIDDTGEQVRTYTAGVDLDVDVQRLRSLELHRGE